MSKHLVWGLLALAACGGGGGDDHWTKWPTQTVEAKAGDVAFSIDVPKGMRERDQDGEVELDIHQNDRVYTPDITIRASTLAPKLDDFLAGEGKSPTITRQDKVGDGFIVSEENSAYPGGKDFIVHSEMPVLGGKTLICNARVTRFRPDDNVKTDLVPKVEQICLSIKPK